MWPLLLPPSTCIPTTVPSGTSTNRSFINQNDGKRYVSWGKRRVARFKMASIETLAQARSIRAREERAEYCIPVPTGTGTDTGTGTAPSSIKFKPTRLYILE